MHVNRVLLLAVLLAAAAGAWRALRLVGRRASRGTLIAREPEFTLRLRSTQGPLTGEGRGGRCALPPGPYLLEGWSARQRDPRGHLWEVRRAEGEPARLIRVPAGGEARLPLAVPIEPELVVEQSGPEVSFRLRLKGAGGETCGQVYRDGRPVPPPSLRIEDARGHVVARLPFDDACGTLCAQRWRPRLGLAQPLRAIPLAALGPFSAAPAAFRFWLTDQRTPTAVPSGGR